MNRFFDWWSRHFVAIHIAVFVGVAVLLIWLKVAQAALGWN